MNNCFILQYYIEDETKQMRLRRILNHELGYSIFVRLDAQMGL